jgi:hypothetical protein
MYSGGHFGFTIHENANFERDHPTVSKCSFGLNLAFYSLSVVESYAICGTVAVGNF